MKVTCNYITHKGKEHILLACEKNTQLNTCFKKLGFVKFSNTHKGWYMPKNKDLLQLLLQKTNSIAMVDISPLKHTPQVVAKAAVKKVLDNITKQAKPATQNTARISDQNIKQLELYIQTLILKGYSQTTIRTYRNEFSIFLQTLQKVNANTLTTPRVKDYLAYCFYELKLTESTVHSRMNALKFYYEQVLNKEKFFWEIPRPKKRLILPKVISEEKIVKYLFAVENLKHRTILLLAYSAGLRVSEVVGLKLTDIDSDRMQIFVKSGKGKKDRIVPLSKTILLLLRGYYNEYKPVQWLFEGQIKGESYSVRSAQIIFKNACAELLLPANIGFHSLRHSYATHLLDSGTDVKYIQSLLGHNDIKTTLRYLHVTNKDLGKIESPLDRIARGI